MGDIIPDSIKRAWTLSVHPSKVTPMSIGDALKFYYSFAIIPAIVAAIMVGILDGALGAAFELAEILAISVVVSFAEAALIQLFGKFVFKKFANPYPATFTTVIVSTIPPTLFVWVSILADGIAGILPGTPAMILLTFGGIAGILLSIWAAVLLTLAIMKLQKVSGLFAILSWIAPTILTIIIIVIVTWALLSFTSSPSSLIGAGGPGALPNSTFNSTFNTTSSTFNTTSSAFNTTTTIIP